MARKKEEQKQLAAKLIIRQAQIIRRDIGDWQSALQLATKVDTPKFYKLQELYTHVMREAFLRSQVSLRINKTLCADYGLTDDKGVVNEDATKIIRELPVWRELMNLCLESLFYGISLVEIIPTGDEHAFTLTLIDRRHINPFTHTVYLSSYDSDGIDYHELNEYGKTLIEFNGTNPASPDNFGIINEAIVDALFMRFAKSCWSELCEIYGMPPRYIKTNIQDPAIRDQYRKMLQDVGSGANYVIDTDDEIGFANTNSTDGGVYEGLIDVCKEEISLLINGAVLGQDTKFGSNSKEETSSKLQDNIIESDQAYLTAAFNTVVLPVFEAAGIIPSGLHFAFLHAEDNSELFDQTMRAAQFYDIDPDWVKDKFGIEVTGIRSFGAESLKDKNLQHLNNDLLDFFV